MTIHQQSLAPQPPLTGFPKCFESCDFFFSLVLVICLLASMQAQFKIQVKRILKKILWHIVAI